MPPQGDLCSLDGLLLNSRNSVKRAPSLNRIILLIVDVSLDPDGGRIKPKISARHSVAFVRKVEFARNSNFPFIPNFNN